MNNNNQQHNLHSSSQDIIDIDGLLGRTAGGSSYTITTHNNNSNQPPSSSSTVFGVGGEGGGDAAGAGEDDLMSLGFLGSSNIAANPAAIDLSKHPSGIIPTLQCVMIPFLKFDLIGGRNVVATVNLECRLDLKTIALHARNAEYNPKVHNI